MTRFEIHDNDIRHNIQLVQTRANVPVWAVLKYDGYGMGAVHMAGLLRERGVTRFAVADAEDAHALRKSGFPTEKILLLSPQSTAEEMVSALHDRAIFSVGSIAYAQRLIALAQHEDCPLQIHIAVDTGMGRFGFLPGQHEQIRNLCQRDDIQAKGIYSHFAGACRDEIGTRAQFTAFCRLLDKLEAEGIDYGEAHIANSPGLFRFQGMELDAVRVGSALVGRVAGTNAAKTGLRKVSTLVTCVCDVRELPRGSRIGYGGETCLRHDTKIAVLAAGRRCGIPDLGRRERLLHRYAAATINGAQAELIATHSVSHAFADVTGLQVSPGDLARIDVNPLWVDSSVERVYL